MSGSSHARSRRRGKFVDGVAREWTPPSHRWPEHGKGKPKIAAAGARKGPMKRGLPARHQPGARHPSDFSRGGMQEGSKLGRGCVARRRTHARSANLSEIEIVMPPSPLRGGCRANARRVGEAFAPPHHCHPSVARSADRRTSFNKRDRCRRKVVLRSRPAASPKDDSGRDAAAKLSLPPCGEGAERSEAGGGTPWSPPLPR